MVDGDAKGLEGPCCRMKTVFMKPSGDGPADQIRKLDGGFWKVVPVFFKGQGFSCLLYTSDAADE